MHRASIIDIYHVSQFENNLSPWDKTIARKEYSMRAQRIAAGPTVSPQLKKPFSLFKCHMPDLRQIWPNPEAYQR